MTRTSRPWSVRHVDLARPLEPLAAKPGAAGAFVVFWAGCIPLGEALLSASELPMASRPLAELAAARSASAVADWMVGSRPSLAALTAVEAPIATLASALDATDEDALSVSVVVCTRDRAESLERCLASLERLRARPRETLVVDNAPTDDSTRDVVARFPGVRYVRESAPGLSRARNAGLRAACGDIVAYTDDDVEVHPDWTARVRAPFRDARVASVTGLVLPAALESDAEWTFEHAGGFGREYHVRRFEQAFVTGSGARAAPVWQIGAGANMAVRRATLERLGGFDERLGAGAAGCSEDSELWYRLLAADQVCAYDPTAVVYHHHRASADALREQMRMYARGHAVALLVQYEQHGHVANLLRLAFGLPIHYARSLVRRLFARGETTLWAEIAGTFSGLGWYLEHRNDTGVPAR